MVGRHRIGTVRWDRSRNEERQRPKAESPAARRGAEKVSTVLFSEERGQDGGAGTWFGALMTLLVEGRASGVCLRGMPQGHASGACLCGACLCGACLRSGACRTGTGFLPLVPKALGAIVGASSKRDNGVRGLVVWLGIVFTTVPLRSQ